MRWQNVEMAAIRGEPRDERVDLEVAPRVLGTSIVGERAGPESDQADTLAVRPGLRRGDDVGDGARRGVVVGRLDGTVVRRPLAAMIGRAVHQAARRRVHGFDDPVHAEETAPAPGRVVAGPLLLSRDQQRRDTQREPDRANLARQNEQSEDPKRACEDDEGQW